MLHDSDTSAVSAAASTEAPTAEALRAAPVGAGIAYRPFLHARLLRERDAVDFVELPLDHYLDDAQRALIDPDFARLDEIVQARTCSWRGTAFSLGSAEASDTRATRAAVSRLVDRTGALLLSEPLAYRRVGTRDLGVPQTVPLTGALADVVGPRCVGMAAALPCKLAVDLLVSKLCSDKEAEVSQFLRRFAAATGCGIVLEIGDDVATLEPSVALARLRGLPAGRVVGIALASTAPFVWPLLDAVLAATAARSVVIRRSRNLFPLDQIFGAVSQARAALAASAMTKPPIARPDAVRAQPPAATDTAHADLIRDQTAFADACDAADDAEGVPDGVAAVRATAVWRERVIDMHRAQQLARWAQRPATWRV